MGGDDNDTDDGASGAEEGATPMSQAVAAESSRAADGMRRTCLEERVFSAMHTLVDRAHSMMLQLQQPKCGVVHNSRTNVGTCKLSVHWQHGGEHTYEVQRLGEVLHHSAPRV